MEEPIGSNGILGGESTASIRIDYLSMSRNLIHQKSQISNYLRSFRTV